MLALPSPLPWLRRCRPIVAIAIAAATARAAAISALASTDSADIATIFGELLSALALPLLRPSLPALALAAVGCRRQRHCCAAANRCPLLLPPQPRDVQNITFDVIF
jgi:hypothetical protein